MNPWNVYIIEKCSIDIFQTEPGLPFHCFIFWNGTKECAHASADSVAQAISQAYVKRCNLWLGEPGEDLLPANVIDPEELIEPPVRDVWLAIPAALLLLLAYFVWRMA